MVSGIPEEGTEIQAVVACGGPGTNDASTLTRKFQITQWDGSE
jgi:hypothetical protein